MNYEIPRYVLLLIWWKQILAAVLGCCLLYIALHLMSQWWHIRNGILASFHLPTFSLRSRTRKPLIASVPAVRSSYPGAFKKMKPHNRTALGKR